jgi:hypothetical protein
LPFTRGSDGDVSDRGRCSAVMLGCYVKRSS